MSVDLVSDAWVQDVVNFWFDELGSDNWFRSHDGVDDEIRCRFGDHHDALAKFQEVEFFLSRAERTLAALIVFDQFSRNMFRGLSEAFASDPLALKLADVAVSKGLDTKVPKHRRVFFYLPFEHSENVDDQYRSVQLISALGNEAFTKYAIAHKAVIDRFGRFPHRNMILGRISTQEEIAFLQEPGSSF